MAFNIAFYRKYRPKNFGEVQGQDFVVQTLKNAVIKNKINHAYILSGPRGIGKTSIAKIFAKVINCLNSSDGDCCNNCINCNLINSHQTMDIVEIDGASNNGVNEVRTIIDNIGYLPTNLKYKIYIIDEAHMLTTGAWNAFLKTIEEPPKHLIFVFATTEPYKFPLTILSRCQRFNLSKLNNYDLENTISNVCLKEQIKIEDIALKKIIKLADGSARDALTFLSQLDIYTNSNITQNDVNQVFGLIDNDQKIELIKNISNLQYEKIINLINVFESKGINFYQLSKDIIEILFDKLLYQKTNNDDLLSVLNKANIDFVNLSDNQLISFIELWQDALNKMKYANDQKFYFELTSLSSIKIFETPINSSNNDDKVVAKENSNVKENVDSDIVQFKNVELKEIATTKHLGNKTNENIESNKIEETNNKIENNQKQQIINVIKTKEKSLSIIDSILDKSFTTNHTNFDNFKSKLNNSVVNNNVEDNLNNVDENKTSQTVIENIEISKPIEKDIEVKKEEKKELDKKQENFTDNLFAFNGQENQEDNDLIKPKDLSNQVIENKKKEIEHKIDKEKIEEIKNKQINQSSDSINIFNQIAFNNNNDLKKQAIEVLNNIKNQIPTTNEDGLLKNAKQILLVSNNGMVLVYDDLIDAKNLNLVSDDTKFINYLKEKFNKVYKVLAISQEQAKQYSLNYKDLYTKNIEFNDINIDELLSKLNKKQTIKDIALDMLKDVIKNESEN